MIHKKKKEKMTGSSKGAPPPPDPPPPRLRPPKLGGYKSFSSYSIAETIDLICDGPILGLVNKFGALLNPSQILQGIYLNDVPVQEPTMFGIQPSIIGLNVSEYNQKLYQSLERDGFEGLGVKRSFSMKPETYYKESLQNTKKLNQEKQTSFTFTFKKIARAIESGELKDPSEDGFELPNNERSGKFLFAKFIEDSKNSSGKIIRLTNTYPVEFNLKNKSYSNQSVDIANPIYSIKTKNNNCSIDLSFTPQNKKCILNEDSSFFKGAKDIQETLVSKNKKEKEILKDVLFYSLQSELNYQDGELNIIEVNVIKNLQDILTKLYNNDNKLANVFGNTKDWISPYICFSYNGLLEGYDSKIHKDVFKDKKEDDKLFFALASDLENINEINPQSFKSLLYPSLDDLGNWRGHIKGFYYIKLNEDSILDLNIIQNYKETNIDFYAELMNKNVINFLKENLRLSISKNGIEL